jgi:imidazolonepropionase
MQSTLDKTADILLSPIGELATPKKTQGPVRGVEMRDIERTRDAAIAIRNGRIIAVGKATDLEKEVLTTADTIRIDAGGKLVTPGLIDPHTHLIFGGNRANEFIMRCQGKSYAEIANAGGGIVASMRGTREASNDQLASDSLARLKRMSEHGTTTCEIKTGYGLDQKTELAMLDVILQLQAKSQVTVIPTFMPAHAIPPGSSRETYVSEIIESMLPAAASLRDSRRNGKAPENLFVDVFCDKGYFTLDDTRLIFEKAKSLGMQLKVHSDEFEALGATAFAIKSGAASADHLLKISDADIELFGQSDTIPILLPGTSFYLNLDEHAPARKLIDAGAAVALGSDFNPGSCHIFSLPFIWGLACLHLKMTPAEALTALTINAAYALRCGDTAGRIACGYRADITIYDVPVIEEVPYNIGWNPVSITIHEGQIVYDKNSH